ncbi:MAG: exonuclease SbcCD subunit D [Bacillota bacterium]|nr:exonuclease SbcCD subunit D [Bacillota bacterium]
MKFIHISDLHLGKYLYGYSLIAQNDQPYWIEQFLKVVDQEQPDAIVMAGDIYDRSIAPREAIKLFSDFIQKLSIRKIPILVIAGNHDSGIRLASMSSLLKKNKVHIVGEITKEVESITLEDAYGPITFWLVPYLFPGAVEQALGIKVADYSQAFETLLKAQNIDYSQRNVLVAHQTISFQNNEPEKGGSEEMVGGVSAIEQEILKDFDYVALGHIHAAQKVGKENIRYAGSPLCYHFDETKKPKKGPLVVEIQEKGELQIRRIDIEPLHPLREVRGHLEEILIQEKENKKTGEYIKVILTDDYVPTGAHSTLETLFQEKSSILMSMEHQPKRSYIQELEAKQDIRQLSLEESFISFYQEKCDGEYPSLDEQKIIQKVCEQIQNKEEESLEEDIDSLIEFVYGLEE